SGGTLLQLTAGGEKIRAARQQLGQPLGIPLPLTCRLESVSRGLTCRGCLTCRGFPALADGRREVLQLCRIHLCSGVQDRGQIVVVSLRIGRQRAVLILVGVVVGAV